MFGDKLREVRKARGYTLDSLSELYNAQYDAGLNKGTLSKYENNKQEPMISVVHNLAILLGVGTDYLLGNTTSSIKGVKIPVLGKVAAGIPIEAVEDIVDYEEITEAMARKGEYFGLQIQGDSMEPKFTSGDIVIVRKQDNAETGDIVIATVNGHDATCKRLQKYAEGLALISTNPIYEPFHFTSKEVNDTPVTILGKVVELRAKF